MGTSGRRAWLIPSGTGLLIGLLVSNAPAAWVRAPITSDELFSSLQETVETGAWVEHQERLDRAVLDALDLMPALDDRERCERLVSNEYMSFILARAALLRVLGEGKLTSLAGREENRDFLVWLMDHREAMEDFLEAVKPGEDPAKVLSLWADLWAEDEAHGDEYYRLALACALVFDRPVKLHPRLSRYGAVDMHERYAFFREAAVRKALKTDLRDLAPWELVWVVDACVPNSELDWARRHIAGTRANWHKAYGMVPYRMEKAAEGETDYEDYSLAEIRDWGGTCGDQAHFAATTAKAHGIPAAVVSGVGRSRGGHAWFMYKANSKEWNTGGRGGNFATGHARDPQTGERIKEQTLYLLTDTTRRDPDFRRASRLIWMADVFNAADDPHRAREALGLAVSLSRRHLAAWERYLESLLADPEGRDAFDASVRELQAAFKQYPDTLQWVNEQEILAASRFQDAAAAAEAAGRQLRRLDLRAGDRSDLYVQQTLRQAELLEKAGDVDGAMEAYEDALRQFGDEEPVFKSLSTSYYAFAARSGRGEDAVKDIGTVFRRHHQEPRGDFFAMRSHANLADFVARFYEKDGQTNKAQRMHRDAEKLRKRAQVAAERAY